MVKTYVPTRVLETINSLLSEAMEVAAANGANSISMPDEYVELASWLCGIDPDLPIPTDSVDEDTLFQLTNKMRELQRSHLDLKVGDVYHTMQFLASTYGYEPMFNTLNKIIR